MQAAKKVRHLYYFAFGMDNYISMQRVVIQGSTINMQQNYSKEAENLLASLILQHNSLLFMKSCVY